MATQAERTTIIKLTVAMFNAAPGAAYLSEMTTYFDATGGTSSDKLLALSIALSQTTAFKTINPNFQTAADFTTSFLTPFGLQNNQEAKDFITAKFNSGANKGQIELEATLALANSSSPVFADARNILVNKFLVAEYFSVTKAIAQTSVSQLQSVIASVDQTSASVDSAKTAIDNGAGGVSNSFTLTTGIDTLVGTASNDVFTGVLATTAAATTLNAGDSIDGAGGSNTLKVVVSDTAGTLANDQFAGVTIKNIQGVSVQNASAALKTFSLAAVPGVTSVTSFNATTGSTVAFTNLAAGTAVISSGSSSAAGINFTMAVPTGAVSVGFDGGVNGVTIAVTTGTATAASISSTGAANGATTADVVTLTTGGNQMTVKTLSVSASTNLKATLSTDFVTTGAALTVSGGASSVNLGSVGVFKTIDASGLTAGGLTISTGATLTSFLGGAGNNNVTVAANPTAAATITFGAGNDSITGTTALNATTVVDGGTGFNTVSASLVNVGSAANIKNFQALDVTGFTTSLDSALLTNSTISAIQFSGAAPLTANTATIQNVANTGTVSVIGAIDQAAVTTATLGSLTLTQVGATPTLAVNFNAAPAVAATTVGGGFFASLGTITSTGDTVVNISSGGGANLTGNGIVSITDTANTITSINITGAKALTLGGIAAIGATTATQSVLTKIDGSAATGNLNITAANSVTVKYDGLVINTGSGNDSITVGVKNATVNGGTGNDKFTVSAFVTTSDIVTITGGAGVKTVVDALAYGQTATGTSSSTIFDLTAFNGAKSLDVLSFATVGNASGALGAKASVGAAATFDQAVFTAAHTGAAVTAAAGTVVWFQYAGNTYVDDIATVGAATSATDIVIKLTGLVDLSGATVVTGANGTITFA